MTTATAFPLAGICPILATPFLPDGRVDEASMERQIGLLLAHGASAVTLFGIAGEYYKLSDEEGLRLARLTVDACRRQRRPAIISVTRHSTELAVEQARAFAELGADCLMLLPPFFLKPSAAAVAAHVRAVAGAVSLPIMVQYAPEQTGVGIAPEVFAAITADHPNVLYYKIECKPPGPYITRLLALTRGAVGVSTGNAGFQLIENLGRGAIGCMPGSSMSDLYVRIHAAWTAGRREEAGALHARLLPLLNHIRQDVEMIIHYEKAIAARRGLIAHPLCRRPGACTDEAHDRLFEELYAGLADLLPPLGA